MMMIVDRELCTGCGACMDVCPSGAILMNGGKAFINQAECTCCQVCAEACRTGALQLARTVSPATVEKPVAIKVFHPQAAMESSPQQSNWGVTILSLVGQHLLPRMVDVLAAFLERRFSPPAQERTLMTMNPVENRPYQRRRQRRGRYSKI